MPQRDDRGHASALAPLVVSIGEREGIGAEVLAKAWLLRKTHRIPTFFVAGVPPSSPSPSAPLEAISHPQEAREVFPRAIPCLGDIREPKASLRQAIALCRDRRAAALTTLPLEKHHFTDEGEGYGHTDFLAKALGDKDYAMMLVAGRLRTLPITRHVALSQAVRMICVERIVSNAQLAARALVQDFLVSQPRLALCALNPHAGEGGLCGDEESRILLPSRELLLERGLSITLPQPADSLFSPETRKTFDCAIAMYHDQALIPIKTLAFHRAVNVTIGLSIVRTSPDHGTAREIEGRGLADPTSLIEALRLARLIAQRRERTIPR